MSPIFLTAPQGSADWFQGRCGATTASMFAEARKRLKSGPNKGDFSVAAHNYAFKLAVERVSGQLLDEPDFDPWQARRGRELEPEARLLYEERYEVLTEQVGLALTEDRLFGASVDSLIGDDGIQEIKCFLAPAKLKGILLDGDIGDCIDQVQGGLWITGRKWCDFTLYCPALAAIGRELTVIRVERDDEFIAELEPDLLAFNDLVESYREKLAGPVDPIPLIEEVETAEGCFA
tara:strand:- start:14366 stop:15067 length:702 start_codon:yes stop_codon:yes gene_type:complete